MQAEEQTVLEKFDKQIYQQRRVNYSQNEVNLNLLREIEELERHIRLTVEHNKLICREIDDFISADQLVAKCLTNRSPIKQRDQPQRKSKTTQHAYESDYTKQKLEDFP